VETLCETCGVEPAIYPCICEPAYCEDCYTQVLEEEAEAART
jgi:hypothetical protein